MPDRRQHQQRAARHATACTQSTHAHTCGCDALRSRLSLNLKALETRKPRPVSASSSLVTGARSAERVSATRDGACRHRRGGTRIANTRTRGKGEGGGKAGMRPLPVSVLLPCPFGVLCNTLRKSAGRRWRPRRRLGMPLPHSHMPGGPPAMMPRRLAGPQQQRPQQQQAPQRRHVSSLVSSCDRARAGAEANTTCRRPRQRHDPTRRR